MLSSASLRLIGKVALLILAIAIITQFVGDTRAVVIVVAASVVGALLASPRNDDSAFICFFIAIIAFALTIVLFIVGHREESIARIAGYSIWLFFGFTPASILVGTTSKE